MTSCQISLATMHVLVVFLTVFFFCFPETRNPSNYRYYKKNSNAVVHLKGLLSPALASENKLQKGGPSFSISVGDFGRLFLAVEISAIVRIVRKVLN